MIEVIISFIYIALFCLTIGSGVRKVLGKWITFPKEDVTGLIVTGIIALTTAVGWISIFFRIGAVVHVFLLIIAVLSAWYSRDELTTLWKKRQFTLADIVLAAFITVIIAFAASRGEFHTDTGIYHAAAIRLYEDYGIIKGVANIQLHYGYNSSYLGFASLFTMSFILPNALHTTTGFLMTVFALDAVFNLKHIKQHGSHYADAVRIAVLLYILMNYTGTVSPATDYGTMLMTGYFLTKWAELADGGIEERDCYGLLSVFALFLVTMKLSAAMCVIVVVLPVYYLIRKREPKKTAVFLITGLLSFLFYPVRNVIISGWLFYPFEKIDLFNVPWKVPVEYSLVDSAQIKVWGRCLYDINKLDMGLSEWFPIWWEAQEHYDQMLIYGGIISVICLILTLVMRLTGVRERSRRFRAPVVIMYIMIAANLAVWFFMAPFVRYGLIFLLSLPLLTAAGLTDTLKNISGRENAGKGMFGAALLRYAGITLLILTGICYCARIDHYVMDDLVFAKQNLSAPYYISQEPFERSDMDVMYLGDARIPIYYPVGPVEKNSYYTPVSTCYDDMAERSEPMGDSVKDGFKPKR
ncbi:MAG: hypothetical protein K5888_10080 [Lachnospiraceae bacterium]|nr:hypothetical protein [Lachnospiraceae bacterium]